MRRLAIIPTSWLMSTPAFRPLSHPYGSLTIAGQKSNFQLRPFQLGPEIGHLESATLSYGASNSRPEHTRKSNCLPFTVCRGRFTPASATK